jgi:5-histidylcysteine sulfoxide synthase/putative 4-mercaptohistidine N1-methyltranferase
MNNINRHATKMPLLSGTDVAVKRAELTLYFNQTWALYESLFDTIAADEAYFIRPEPLRHPLIFYFGHTATFFINKLLLGKFIKSRVDNHIESICAVGVDEMSWDDLNTEHYDWPSVSQVKDYRDTVKALINQLIEDMPLTLPIKPNSLAWVILMGIEHERIHVETSSVIMRMLPLSFLNNSLTQDNIWNACPYTDEAPTNGLIGVAATTVTLGKPTSDDTYGWDNEYGSKTVAVDAFNAGKYLVSNQEFMAFVEDSGYQSTQYWDEEGQNWLSFSKATMPIFWVKRDGHYYQRNLLEEIKLPLNWPVEVNHLEAKAFCNWKSRQTSSHIRLPTEPEWTCLRNQLEQNLPDWAEAPGNINLEYFASPCPVDKFATGELFDVIGNVWQWTQSPFDGFSGFKVHPLYDDFSTPTFDGKHNLIKGGSWISTGNLAQKHSRYAFRRHFFQHAGFRYVQTDSSESPVEKVNCFEENPAVAVQLELHYADLKKSADLQNDVSDNKSPIELENYAVSCVNACLNHFDQPQSCRVLDLGCSVGRSSFELATHFSHVDAIDFTARLIQHAFGLQEQGESRYTIKAEGEIMAFKDINITDHPYNDVKHKVNFSQGDACNLKPRYSGYDLILCNNLLEQMYNPELFLTTIDQRLNAQGYLVLTSCYDWPDESANSKWLGGVKVNGENFTSLDGLKQLLDDRFELIETRDIPFVLKRSARQYQLNNSEMSVWRLKTGE